MGCHQDGGQSQSPPTRQSGSRSPETRPAPPAPITLSSSYWIRKRATQQRSPRRTPPSPKCSRRKPAGSSPSNPMGRRRRTSHPSSPGDKIIPATAPKYKPNYLEPDGADQSFDESLLEARRQGIINREQGRRCSIRPPRSGIRPRATARRWWTRRPGPTTTRSPSAVRRSTRPPAVGQQPAPSHTAYGDYSKHAGKLPQGSGGVAADAFLAALDLGKENAGLLGRDGRVARGRGPQGIAGGSRHQDRR